MAGRGQLTDEIKRLSRDLLGYEIDTVEFRLMPYVLYVMMNEQRLDIPKINQAEREILKKWREAGHIEGGAGGLSITEEFWGVLCRVCWHGYVAYEAEEKPEDK